MFKIEFVQNKKVVQREKCWDRAVAAKIAQSGGYDDLVHYDQVNIYRQAGINKKLIEVVKH
tara:strand:+ start:325 stop:507 length:183 start_codon:yes stop_codon:yes gene_type:complete